MSEATPFDKSASVVLATVNGVSGYGLIRLAPSGEKWQITRVRVECSTRTNEAECRWYLRQVATGNCIDGTYSGSSGDTSDTVAFLNDGQAMFIEWRGGDNGATATVNVSGWTSAPQGGFRAVH